MIKVSILIPVFNGAATLERALDSLSTQTEPSFEALIVDDGSTDETAQIARTFAQEDPRFRLLTPGGNHGVSFARNAALAAAQGQWIATLDADDWYEPERLALMLAAAEKVGADAVIDNLKICDHTTGLIFEETCFGNAKRPERLTPQALFAHDTPLVRYAVGYARPLVKASFLKDHALCYDERFHLGEDFLFLAEILLRGGVLFILPFAAYVHVHRLSPSTGRISPFSRSIDDHEQIIRSGSMLAARYNELTFVARLALHWRLFLFHQLVQARRLKALIQARQGRKALVLFITRPDVTLFGGLIGALRWLRQKTQPSIKAR